MNDQPSAFEQIKKVGIDGIEYWLARDLQYFLGYYSWDKFYTVVRRAILTFNRSAYFSEEHFSPFFEQWTAKKFKRKNYRLSRLGCYLVIESGDQFINSVLMAQESIAEQSHQIGTEAEAVYDFDPIYPLTNSRRERTLGLHPVSLRQTIRYEILWLLATAYHLQPKQKRFM